MHWLIVEFKRPNLTLILEIYTKEKMDIRNRPRIVMTLGVRILNIRFMSSQSLINKVKPLQPQHSLLGPKDTTLMCRSLMPAHGDYPRIGWCA